MPKKTKKQKILAERRRKNITPLISYSLQTNKISEPTVQPAFSFQPSQQIHHSQPQVETDTTELPVIKHDLMKTLILAFIAFSIEIGIYWQIHVK